MGPQLHTKLQHNRASRYRVAARETFMEKGCGRAHVRMHPTYDLCKALR